MNTALPSVAGTSSGGLNHEEIVRLTEEYGGPWGINHTRRLLHLIGIIGDGRDYDREATWLAAHLHDWGAYNAWAQPGVDHAIRSRQVADVFLAQRNCRPTLAGLVLECIEFHHQGSPERSIEAQLLSDADALDFLGVMGILRDFSRNPKDLRRACQDVQRHRQKLPGVLCLPQSQALAAPRIEIMDAVMAAFAGDSFGYF
jgi:uncharacterized protein